MQLQQDLSSIVDLHDSDLRHGLCALALSDRQTQVGILIHLAELDRRATFVSWGYASLWDYCRRELMFSESIAVRRICAARTIAKFPAALPLIHNGTLNVCGLALLAPHLTAANADDLLAKVRGMSKRQIEVLLAQMGSTAAPIPKKDVIRLIGAVSVPSHDQDSAGTPADGGSPLVTPSEPTPKAPVPRVNIHRISFNGSDALIENITRLKEILGQRNLDDLMKRASEALLDRVDPVRRHRRREAKAKLRAEKTKAKAKKPDAGRPQPTTSHRQPIALRDAVHVRDDERCTFQSGDGVRCGAKGYLHIDHIRPYALGGSSLEIGNSRLLCSAHNLLRGRETFGDQRRPSPR